MSKTLEAAVKRLEYFLIYRAEDYYNGPASEIDPGWTRICDNEGVQVFVPPDRAEEVASLLEGEEEDSYEGVWEILRDLPDSLPQSESQLDARQSRIDSLKTWAETWSPPPGVAVDFRDAEVVLTRYLRGDRETTSFYTVPRERALIGFLSPTLPITNAVS